MAEPCAMCCQQGRLEARAGREGGRELQSGALLWLSGCRHNAALRDKVSSAQWGAGGDLGEGETGSDR